jgi:ribonucleoside-triphosphate reductase
MDIINKAFLEVMTEGDAKGRVFTFPIPTYNITKDFDWENPTLQYLWEATAKYGIPYFSNFVNSDMDPNDARSMCCRLRLDTRKLQARGGGLFGANPLTGSIGVVTLNLPRIGHLAENEEDFFARLQKILSIAMSSLEIKRKVLETYTNSVLYPYTRFYLKNIRERFEQYWKNHFSTIGIIGMNEACENFLGMNLGQAKAQAFALKVMDYLRERLIEFQDLTGNNYNLEATPAEGTSYRLAILDRRNHPGIKCANCGGDAPFYTNSTQLPVNYSDDVFEVLDLQDDLQCKYTGGTVLHIFGGERLEHAESVKNLVRALQQYSTLFHLLTHLQHLSKPWLSDWRNKANAPPVARAVKSSLRIVGYLRPVSQWNEGKQAEFKLRTTFDSDFIKKGKKARSQALP